MPELPDVTVYVEALQRHLGGATLQQVRLASPFVLRSVTPPLYAATRKTLIEWTDRLRAETVASPDGFPVKVTAFREGMAVHGRYGQPCPVCGGRVARIVYAENEANYCPRCQTDGRMLADRALSRLLKEDWPRTADELKLGPARAVEAKPPSRRGKKK